VTLILIRHQRAVGRQVRNSLESRLGRSSGVWIPHSMPILTEVRIRAARPREKAYKLFDLRGLFMLVTPTGAVFGGSGTG
jgi:hypothetical protein